MGTAQARLDVRGVMGGEDEEPGEKLSLADAQRGGQLPVARCREGAARRPSDPGGLKVIHLAV